MTLCGHVLSLLLLVAGGSPIEADTVIRNALLCDGTSATAIVGDVAIRGDCIVAVGKFQTRGAPREINATGLIAAPAFIDLHTHSDPITKDSLRGNLNYLTQGVATVVTGNCGGGSIDVAKYFDEIDKKGAGTNVAHLIGHGAVRGKVMKTPQGKPDADELARMKAMIAEGMEAGAWGISTGLTYVPGCFAETDELVELARVAGRYGAIYASHIRGEDLRLLDSISEIIEIGRRAELPVHISHFKVVGRPAWDLSVKAIALIEQARRRGQHVTADQYPYIASSTGLAPMVIPSEYRNAKELTRALADPKRADSVRKGIEAGLEARSGAENLVVSQYAKNPSWQGKDLATIARQEGKPVVALVVEIVQNGGASMVNFAMQEEEVRRIMRLPFVATGSDGTVMLPDSTLPHPRSYGCFPRKIGRYAIEAKTLSPEQAIRSASGLPADSFGIPERGYLRAGYFADVVVFDPKTFRDTATFEAPHQYATGVRYLFVNGKAAIADGKVTGELAGRALRHHSAVDARGAGAQAALPIGVFDSGTGGLAVLEEILKLDVVENGSGKPAPRGDGQPDLQQERFTFLADQANMPYGNYPAVGKTSFLLALIRNDALFLLGTHWYESPAAEKPRDDKQPVKAIVIACNTATAYGKEMVEAIAAESDPTIPVIGVVDAGSRGTLEFIAQRGGKGGIGVFATKGTVASQAYPNAVRRLEKDYGFTDRHDVIQQGSLGLAGAIDNAPEFIRRDVSNSQPRSDYKGPSFTNQQAPIDRRILARYDFDWTHHAMLYAGTPDAPTELQINSVENYIAYDVVSLMESVRAALDDRARAAPMQPLSVMILGCTHFPYYAAVFQAELKRLYDYREDGRDIYRPYMAAEIAIVDPAVSIGKELYGRLSAAKRLAETLKLSAGETRGEFYITVPNRRRPNVRLDPSGWFTYEYKYGRNAADAGSDYRAVPLLPKDLEPPVEQRLERQLPRTWQLLQQYQEQIGTKTQ